MEFKELNKGRENNFAQYPVIYMYMLTNNQNKKL